MDELQKEITKKVELIQRRIAILNKGSLSNQVLFILDTAQSKEQIDFEIRTLIVKMIKQLESNQITRSGRELRN